MIVQFFRILYLDAEKPGIKKKKFDVRLYLFYS